MSTTAQLWDRFATFENLLLAWQRTANTTSRMVTDELGMRVFEFNLQANLEELLHKLETEDLPYEPSVDHKVYVPKPSSTLRTMSLMCPQDLIVYQGLVNVIADIAHPSFVSHEREHIWGNLYAGSGKRWMLKPWKELYTGFVNCVESNYRAGNPWIASTDIVSFYDTIDHAQLLRLIESYCGKDERFMNLLQQCLAKWSAHNPDSSIVRGIPQGSNASDFLASLFLHEVDRRMIVAGYRYIRYVDDVRILGPDKATVQHGLIKFDLELKKSGLVAQVSKTSIHEIDNIRQEIARLRFAITDPTGGMSIGVIDLPTEHVAEQAKSIVDRLDSANASDNASDFGMDLSEQDDAPDIFTDSQIVLPDVHYELAQAQYQQVLRKRFSECLLLLNDPNESKSAESGLTFCLFRLSPSDEIREDILLLLNRLPWRSHAIATCLSRFRGDKRVASTLREFINEHRVYSWHRANVLWALEQVEGAQATHKICRAWLTDGETDWYAQAVAAKILSKVGAHHSFLLECLKHEQSAALVSDPEARSILRQQLAIGAFMLTKSKAKQLASFRTLSSDPSKYVRRLAIYLLQQPECKLSWDDTIVCHSDLNEFADLIALVGLSLDAPRQCFIANTLKKMYEVDLSANDLRPLYGGGDEYVRAVNELRKSITAFQSKPDEFVRSLHQFCHLTLIAFYKSVIPKQSNLYSRDYSDLTDCKDFSPLVPRSLETWKKVGSLRNRVDHPVNRNTKTVSKRITAREADDLFREMKLAFHELFGHVHTIGTPISGNSVYRVVQPETTAQ